MTRRTLLFATVGVIGGAAALVHAADETSRYPFDPACPWGRISNGKGMIVRCLGKAESELVMARTPAPSASTGRSSAAAPSASSAAPPANAAPLAPESILVELSVSADEGKLPIAERKLSVAKPRFAECPAKLGGLSSAGGEVELRFLVRAQRGRAEGVSVKRRTGVTAEAARCAAEVLDRRLVGEPGSEVIGATLVVKFSPASK